MDEEPPFKDPDGLDTCKAHVASGDDLARRLFGNASAPLASVVRDLQNRHNGRTKPLARLDENAVTKIDAVEDEHDLETGRGTADDANQAALSGVVIGGGTTIVDTIVIAGKGKAEATKVHVAGDAVGPSTPRPSPQALQQPITDAAASSGAQPKNRKGVRACWSSTAALAKELCLIVRLYPVTLLLPLAVFGLLCGLGVWGVVAGARSVASNARDEARTKAVDAAAAFQIQLLQTYTPGVTISMLVQQRPDWEYWLANFNRTADALLWRVPAGSIYNLQLQPFAQVMLIEPMRPSDLGQVEPARDLLQDPDRRAENLEVIRTKTPLVVGPYNLSQGFMGGFVRYPIYVSDCDRNETFNFRFRDNKTALTYEQLPESVRDCTDAGICYNAATREKWWGLLTATINLDAVTRGPDSYLSNLLRLNYKYALVKPIDATQEQVIVSEGGGWALKDADAVEVPVVVVGVTWRLRVRPQAGFDPSWRGPVVAAVVVISLLISSLLFASLASFKKQRLMLHETMAANHQLAETTKRLEEEKERMDVLLIRQYELLQCLDTNRNNKKHIGGGTSKRAMLARIAATRRSLDAAKATQEDPIQIFELLGQGAFGKVQKGLWRGTEVAVKTMILPANMSGKEKREKMAVMEAAISSSLVHPNIVTTYTYFIRPYREPRNERIKHMALCSEAPYHHQHSSTRACGGSADGTGGGGSQGSSNESADGTLHSYEVRLVLEFCDKGSLKDALDQHAFMTDGALNLAAILETAADIAKAMVHMHAANVLHSDLKARNIMLKSSGTEGRGVVAKVADFGLSTRMEHAETHLSSCFQGTLTHMAPEVLLEGRMSKAADVYSFGIVLWELFCASDPFAGVPRAHLGHAITKEGRRPEFPHFGPRDYVALAKRCWDPDAAVRPSFEQVLSELVRMRSAYPSATRPLTIHPTRPLSIISAHSTAGDSGTGPSRHANRHGNGLPSAAMGTHTLGLAGFVLGGASTSGDAATVAAAVRQGGGRSSSGGSIGGGSSSDWQSGHRIGPTAYRSGSTGSGPVRLKEFLASASAPGALGSSVGGANSGGGGGGAVGGMSAAGMVAWGMYRPPAWSSSGAAATAVTASQRAAMKAALASRHLRKMGIRGGGSGSGMLARLPSLQEHHEEGEPGEGGPGGEGAGLGRGGSDRGPVRLGAGSSAGGESSLVTNGGVEGDSEVVRRGAEMAGLEMEGEQQGKEEGQGRGPEGRSKVPMGTALLSAAELPPDHG